MSKSRTVPDFNEQDIANLSFMLMHEAVFVYNEEGVLLHVNQAGVRYFGTDTENVVGKKLYDFFPRNRSMPSWNKSARLWRMIQPLLMCIR